MWFLWHIWRHIGAEEQLCKNNLKPTIYLTSQSARQVTNSLKILTWSIEAVDHRITEGHPMQWLKVTQDIQWSTKD
jgi:hypothetical protein